ncbi:MAG: lipid asymmetry maintenance protein MlaB [Sphingomonas sp.]
MMQILLPAHCDRAAAAALLSDMAAAVEAGAVTVDGSGVTRIGQAMFQLLLSVRATAAAKGHVVTVTASQAMRETAQLVGLEPMICDKGRP